MLLIGSNGLVAGAGHGVYQHRAGVFILPFFLFSATAGQIAEKFEKSRIIRGVKLLEIAAMTIAAYGS